MQRTSLGQRSQCLLKCSNLAALNNFSSHGKVKLRRSLWESLRGPHDFCFRLDEVANNRMLSNIKNKNSASRVVALTGDVLECCCQLNTVSISLRTSSTRVPKTEGTQDTPNGRGSVEVSCMTRGRNSYSLWSFAKKSQTRHFQSSRTFLVLYNHKS